MLALLRQWWKVGRQQGVMHPKGWLFPGQHAGKPISTRQLHRIVVEAARSGHRQAGRTAYVAPQLRHAPAAAFATTIQHVGALGDGHRLKLVNNFISLGYAALYSEALALAIKAGLSAASFDDLVRSSRMHCGYAETSPQRRDRDRGR